MKIASTLMGFVVGARSQRHPLAGLALAELRAFRDLHRSAEWLALLIVDAYEKGEQVCMSETDLVRAVNRVNETFGLPRVEALKKRRGPKATKGARGGGDR